MYIRSERPLTKAEKNQCRDWLREGAIWRFLGEFGAVVLIGVLLLSLCVVLLVDAATGKPGPWIRVGAAIGVGIAGLWLVVMSYRLFRQPSPFPSRRVGLREALEDGVAVVERIAVQAGRLVWLTDDAWVIAALGGGRLLVMSRFQAPLATPLLQGTGGDAGSRDEAEVYLSSCLEVTVTRRHRIVLGIRQLGNATVPLQEMILVGTVASAARPESLVHGAIIAGDLDHLPEALDRLQDSSSLQVTNSSDAVDADLWPLVQAQVEERFTLDLGPGGLRRAVAEQGHFGPTVDELLAVLMGRFSPTATWRALPVLKTFFQLRVALTYECQVERSAIRPSTCLGLLFPRGVTRAHWERLAQRLGRTLPPVTDSGMPVVVGLIGMILVGVLYGVGVPVVQALDSFAENNGFIRAWWIYLIGMVLVPPFFIFGIVASFLLPGQVFRHLYRVELPSGCQSVGGLARVLAASSEEVRSSPWTEETTLVALRVLLANVVGRRPIEITRQTRLADLGLASPVG